MTPGPQAFFIGCSGLLPDDYFYFHLHAFLAWSQIRTTNAQHWNPRNLLYLSQQANYQLLFINQQLFPHMVHAPPLFNGILLVIPTYTSPIPYLI